MFEIPVCLRWIKNYSEGYERIKSHNVTEKLINFYADKLSVTTKDRKYLKL